MREIRFRGFAEKTKRMIDLKKITPLALHAEMDEQDGLFLPFSDDLILMQFTGLQDRNGKDIYESDLLEWSYVNPMTGDKVMKFYEVAFDKGNFYARLVGHHPYGTTMLYFANKDAEVIGNIHENPELLESTT